jgi:inorganic pyrophosphatase
MSLSPSTPCYAEFAQAATWAGDEAIHIVVETPRGAPAKLTYDPELKTFVLSKSLMLGLSYPYDWGFIPSTRAEDGVMRCKLLGVLQTLQETKQHRIRNDRIIAVLEDSHREQELSDVQGLLPEVKQELY